MSVGVWRRPSIFTSGSALAAHIRSELPMPLIPDTAFQNKLSTLPLATYRAGETVLTAASTTGRLLISGRARSPSSRMASSRDVTDANHSQLAVLGIQGPHSASTNVYSKPAGARGVVCAPPGGSPARRTQLIRRSLLLTWIVLFYGRRPGSVDRYEM